MGFAIGTFVVYILIVLTLQAIRHWIGASGPLVLGLAIFRYPFRNQDARLEQIFQGSAILEHL